MKYFKNTSWLFAEKILRMVVGIFVGVWVARYLGPEQFGLFSYAQSFVGLFATIATLGLNSIVVREIVKDDSKTCELIGTSFYLKLIGAFIVLLLLAIAINFTSNDNYTNTLVFIIASSTIFQAFNVVDFYFQAKVMSRYVVYTNVVSLFISTLIKITLILNNAALEAFVWLTLFDNVVLACGVVYFFFKKSQFKIEDLKFKSKVAFSLLKDSWPLVLSGMVIAIYMKIDQVMIKEMLGSTEVGQYAAAVRLSEAWYFIPMVINSSLFPAIINAKKVSEELYYKRLQKLFKVMVIISLCVSMLMTFLSDFTINLLYGIKYSAAADVLMIHIWATLFIFLLDASGKWYTVENLTLYALSRNLLGAISNIILNIVLIPKYGINGAAIATFISYGIAGFLFDIISKKTRKIFILKLNAIRLKG